jgi:hypothetical protein
MYPYLTTARFPHNWAIADMVKGYIAGTRKEYNRQAREDEGERSTAGEKKTTHSSSTQLNKSSLDLDDKRPCSKPATTTITDLKKHPRSDSIDMSDVEDEPCVGQRASTKKSAPSNTMTVARCKTRISKRSQPDSDADDIYETNGPESKDLDNADDNKEDSEEDSA